MRDINEVMLIGRLTKDPEIKMTQNGKDCLMFNLAVNRDDNDANFIRCVAFEKIAQNINQYLHRGDRLAVIGTLISRSYQNQNGQRVFITEVLVRQTQFLNSKNNNNQQNNGYPTDNYQASQATNNQSTQSFDDDDLPF